ncbi:MAG: four-carbon acid sugar kinase family protein [Opitutales bacterium]
MILAFADDFSGAAEVAGVAHRYGLQAIVTTCSEIPENCEFVAFDMATRSMTEDQASAKALVCGKLAAHLSPTLLYKKTDSVLRGHLAIELSAMLSSTGRSLGLLVPANPARNRTISNGVYRIEDIPLIDTEFARDPVFPIHSSQVKDLVLGAESLAIGASLPKSGLVVGDAVTERDLEHWAERTNDAILPAGASPFLAALLRARGEHVLGQVEPNDLCERRILLVCGSQSDNSRHITKSLRKAGAPVFETSDDSIDEFAKRIADSIAMHPVTVLRHPREASDSPEELTSQITAIVNRVLELHTGMPPHLCLEGGETAASVLQRLGEKRFQVTHEGEPGVVTLASDRQLLATVKPGSYRWPAKLLGFESS